MSRQQHGDRITYSICTMFILFKIHKVNGKTHIHKLNLNKPHLPIKKVVCIYFIFLSFCKHCDDKHTWTQKASLSKIGGNCEQLIFWKEPCSIFGGPIWSEPRSLPSDRLRGPVGPARRTDTHCKIRMANSIPRPALLSRRNYSIALVQEQM